MMYLTIDDISRSMKISQKYSHLISVLIKPLLWNELRPHHQVHILKP